MVECTQKAMLFLIERHVDVGFLEDHEESVSTVEIDVKG